MALGKAKFRGGRNIAMKLPERDYAKTLTFYAETLGLEVISQDEAGAIIAFGDLRLHLDRIPHQSQTDIWLEVQTNETNAARQSLAEQGVTICDEVEPLPDGFDGFWVAAPNGTIHLIDQAPEGDPHG